MELECSLDNKVHSSSVRTRAKCHPQLEVCLSHNNQKHVQSATVQLLDFFFNGMSRSLKKVHFQPVMKDGQ